MSRKFKFSLFLLATDVVTVYVFHEPSLLSSLQDKDLTGVVLKSLVVKDVSAMNYATSRVAVRVFLSKRS